MDETVVVSSTDIEASAPNILHNLWKDKDFTDVTLISADNQQLKAHKVVLSSCSPVLGHILRSNPHPQPLLYLHHLQADEVSRLLELIYLGQTSLETSKLERFLEVAEQLKICGLSSQNGKPVESKVVTHSNQTVSDKIKTKLKEYKQNLIPEEKYGEDKIVHQETIKQKEYELLSSGDKLEADATKIDKKLSNTIGNPLSFSALVGTPSQKKQICIDPAKFLCDICPFKFQNDTILQVHIKSKHSGLPERTWKPRKSRSDQKYSEKI